MTWPVFNQLTNHDEEEVGLCSHGSIDNNNNNNNNNNKSNIQNVATCATVLASGGKVSFTCQ